MEHIYNFHIRRDENVKMSIFFTSGKNIVFGLVRESLDNPTLEVARQNCVFQAIY